MERKVKIKKRERIITAILLGVLLILILILAGSFLYLRNTEHALKQEGMGDLMLDSEDNSTEDPSPGAGTSSQKDTPETDRNTSGSGSETGSGTGSGQITAGNIQSSSSSEGGESDHPQDTSSSENPDSSEAEENSPDSDSDSSSGDSVPPESTNRHPYELPLVPVRNS